MKLKLACLVLGPLQNNVFFLTDEETKDCVIVDPSLHPQEQAKYLAENDLTLRQLWVSHGHYDHFLGVPSLMESQTPHPLFGMNPDSFAHAQKQEEQYQFGMTVRALPPIDLALKQGDKLSVDPASSEKFVEVREVPGHCPGSVIFYCPKGGFALVGDAIFRGSIGRTDFEGGDEALLLKSIREQIFTLPPETVLFPGHGPQTMVGYEMENNPFFMH
ncbi:MAG: MBL fold metallo-hydrolase [Anaerolineaceae bacterium]|nr:MBL fold metallo-hydrolase [Anaerolineaceae bacterium]